MAVDYFEKYGMLCGYKEYGADDAVSMLDCCEKTSYPEKEEIISFLNTRGESTLASTGTVKDRITGEVRPMPKEGICLKTEGQYSWWNDLSYYVDKYNLRLPKQFEDYVLNHSA